jgi:hypothetical protein
MTRDYLKNKLLFQDLDFIYKGVPGSFCPIEVYSVTYGDITTDFDDIDEAIDAPLFGGKSLAEIADEIIY